MIRIIAASSDDASKPMIPRPRLLQAIGLSFTSLLVLLAASEPPASPEWTRLQAMPRAERQRLWENLQRFDKLRPADQEIARELDRRIAAIDNPGLKAHYLSVLRRYHLWFEGLPQARRDELLKASPDNRMALVSKFLGEPKTQAKAAGPLLLLQIADLSMFSPVEVAIISKVWQKLGPEGRADLEKLPLPQLRNRLALRGARSDVTAEGLLPPGYNEAEWRAELEKRPQRLFRHDQIAKKKELSEEMKRHLALNLYFLEHPPKAVSEANLAQFLSQLPNVVRSSFDIFTPDEAKRRLTISYRLVYRDDEIPAPPKPGAAATGKPQPGVPPSPAPPRPAEKKAPGPPAGSAPVVPL